MSDVAFWCFFGFGIVSVLLALGGGGYVIAKSGAGENVLAYLLLFLGACLLVMLGSLLVVRAKERRQNP